MKTLAELQDACGDLGLVVESTGRPNKEVWITALRRHFWERDDPGQPIPEQIEPMLLGDWNDITAEQAESLENDHHAWAVQPKLDGCRALFHIKNEGIRVTSRTISDVTFRLSEHQDNVPHLSTGLQFLQDTILDGELVCPIAKIDTGSTNTENALQAAVAILATSPDKALSIQAQNDTYLEFHVFDVLRFQGHDVTQQPLSERLDILNRVIGQTDNPFIRLVPTGIVGKRSIHDRIIDAGGEGTVWKRLDQPYEPGRRVKHWIKRKCGIEVEAFVTAFKTGSADRGNRHLVGAVEFSTRNSEGANIPIAWVSSWTDDERAALTVYQEGGSIQLNPSYIGRRAMVVGQDRSARSHRIRHARLKQWIS